MKARRIKDSPEYNSLTAKDKKSLYTIFPELKKEKGELWCKYYEGTLDEYFETGSEGICKVLTMDGYACGDHKAMQVFLNYDYLCVYDKEGELVWRGMVFHLFKNLEFDEKLTQCFRDRYRAKLVRFMKGNSTILQASHEIIRKKISGEPPL